MPHLFEIKSGFHFRPGNRFVSFAQGFAGRFYVGDVFERFELSQVLDQDEDALARSSESRASFDIASVRSVLLIRRA